jgi:hypothetical protein
MATFIKCNTSVGSYFEGYENNPINIDLVTSVKKSRHHRYPDKEGAPCLIFKGIDEKWIYDKIGGEAKRDEDYDNIINNRFNAF